MKLYKKLLSKKIKVGVIGLGYVGLPIVKSLCKKKINVIGFDTDKTKIKKLFNYNSYILSIKNSDIKSFIKNKYFIPSYDFTKLNEVDIIVICVPTPLKKNLLPDLSYVEKSIEIINKYRREEQLIILESTTYPETTTEKIIKKTENKKFKLGKNYYVGYSPEREDPGNKNFNNTNIPKIISAEDNNSLLNIQTFYKLYVKNVVRVKNTKTAETVKLFENIFRAVNIALVNEVKMILMKMNIDMWDVVEAAKTKPFGFMPFYPGPGFGGHCIPVDPFYLTWKANQVGEQTEFIKLAGIINRSMPKYIFQHIKLYFKNNKLILKKILVLGLSYKKDIPDIRESPSLYILKLLNKKNIKCDYYDPYFKTIPKNSIFNKNLKSINIKAKNLKYYDAILIVTNHTKINYGDILKKSKLIFDTRNVYSKKSSKIIRI